MMSPDFNQARFSLHRGNNVGKGKLQENLKACYNAPFIGLTKV